MNTSISSSSTHQINLETRTPQVIAHEIKTHNSHYLVLSNHTFRSSPPPEASKLAAAIHGIAMSRKFKEVHFQFSLTEALSVQIIEALKEGKFNRKGINLENTLFLEVNPVTNIRELFFNALPQSGVSKLTLKVDKRNTEHLAKAITKSTKLNSINGNYYALRKREFSLLQSAILKSPSLVSMQFFRGFYTHQKQLNQFKEAIKETLQLNRQTLNFLKHFSNEQHFSQHRNGQKLIASFINSIQNKSIHNTEEQKTLTHFKSKDWSNQLGQFLTPRDGLMLARVNRATNAFK